MFSYSWCKYSKKSLADEFPVCGTWPSGSGLQAKKADDGIVSEMFLLREIYAKGMIFHLNFTPNIWSLILIHYFCIRHQKFIFVSIC